MKSKQWIALLAIYALILPPPVFAEDEFEENPFDGEGIEELAPPGPGGFNEVDELGEGADIDGFDNPPSARTRPPRPSNTPSAQAQQQPSRPARPIRPTPPTPSRTSARPTPPPSRPAPSRTAKTPTVTIPPKGSTSPRLAEYLELDSSVKGLQVQNFDLQDRDIKDVVKLISKWTGKNFILDNKVRGKITILGPSQVTLQEAYQAFLSALAANGLTTVQTGKFIRIIESADARRSPVKTYTGDFAPTDDQFITRIYQLNYINADEVQREFRDMTTRQGKLFAYEPTNSIIITDTGSNIKRILEILKTLDVKSFETSLHVLPIKHNSAKAIADMLDQIFGEKSSGSRRSSRSRFRKSNLERTRGGGIVTKIVPDEQINSLVVLANKAGLANLKRLVSKLDIKTNNTGRLHVYYCEYAKAEDLAATLASLSGGSGGARRNSTSSRRSGSNSRSSSGSSRNNRRSNRSSSPVTATIGEGISITSDAATNALVITANASDYKTIRNVIKKLDIPRLQVFVETAIMELSANDDDQYNLNLGGSDPNFPFVGGFIGDSTQLVNYLTNPTGMSGAVLPFMGGGALSHTINGASVTTFSFMGLLNVIKRATEASVLSTPQIIALDNEEATLKILDKIPVSSGTTAATATSGPITNISTEEVGIELKITPHVNAASGTVRLEIEQTVDNVKTDNTLVPDNVSDDAIATTSRVTNTTVVVKDKNYVMLGGLMSENVTEIESKVPLLGDIPILGWLFKNKTWEKRKSNLVVLLKPTIIGTTLQAADIIEKNLKRRKKFIDESMSISDLDTSTKEIEENVRAQKSRGQSEPMFNYRNNDGTTPTPKPGEQSEFKPGQEAKEMMDTLPTDTGTDPANKPNDPSVLAKPEDPKADAVNVPVEGSTDDGDPLFSEEDLSAFEEEGE